MGCETHALPAQGEWHVTAAHEEAVDGGAGVFSGCRVEEPDATADGGVGGKGRDEGVEVGMEGAVWSESVVATAAHVVEHGCRGFCNGQHKNKGSAE